jgi:hypothetical protein
MQNLYDVFTAIRADEGDHVSTMVACLDEGATLKSPSMERRILTGIALVVAASYYVGTAEIPSSLLDSVDLDAAATSADVTLAEFMAAGVAGFAQKFAEDEQARDMTELAVDAAEGGAAASIAEQLRRLLVELARFIGRLL